MEFIVPVPSVLNEDSDESYLKHVSLYATVRQGDLKTILESRRHNHNEIVTAKRNHLSLQDLFSAVQDRAPFCPRQNRIDEVQTSPTEDVTPGQTTTLRGEDIHDLPVQYTVQGVRPYEFPVKGTLSFIQFH